MTLLGDFLDSIPNILLPRFLLIPDPRPISYIALRDKDVNKKIQIHNYIEVA